MNRLKIAVFAIALLALSGATSFAVVSLLGGSDSTATANIPQQDGISNVTSVAEAEELLGYSLASPEFLPTGFIPSEYIEVKEPTFGSAPPFAERSWHSQQDPNLAVILIQDPSLHGIGGAEPAVVSGVSGERLLLPARPPGRPHPLLILFWRDGEFGYNLSGSLGGTLTEKVLMQVADSIQLP